MSNTRNKGIEIIYEMRGVKSDLLLPSQHVHPGNDKRRNITRAYFGIPISVESPGNTAQRDAEFLVSSYPIAAASMCSSIARPRSIPSRA